MEKDEIIRQLERENELLKARIGELEKLIAFYENAHTPPSLRRGFCGGTNGKDHEKSGGGKPGRKKGHRGVNRPQPEPQPVTVTKFKIAHYACPGCHREVIATHQDCPKEGGFGKNVIAQATLAKYEDRLPYRKIQNLLKRQYGLTVSPASILDFTRRASDAVRSEYEAILKRIRSAPIYT